MWMKSKPSTHRFWLALALLAWATLVSAAEIAATIAFASGSPRIVDAAGAERAAANGGELRSGDTLDTRDGIVQLRFRDGASMSLQAATRFRVDDYVFAGEGKAADGDRGFFSLIRGGFRTITGLIGKARRGQYRVTTGAAVIGIRGTNYQAAMDDSGLTVSTTAGLVAVCNDTGCVEVRPGQTVFIGGWNAKPRFAVSETSGSGLTAPLPPPQITAPGLEPAAPSGAVTPPTAPTGMTTPSAPTGPTGMTTPPAPTGFTVMPTGPSTGPTGGASSAPLH